VAAEHRAGTIATVPGDLRTHMTLNDFRALRNSMRRHNPAYKLPPRRHQPPPPEWQLYINTDARSGPDFASVLYVDVTKGRIGPDGIPTYGSSSIRVDLGFIPVTIGSPTCGPQTLVDRIQQLAINNRLILPVAGGWKPVAGFPFRKTFWQGPNAERHMIKLCQDLTAAMTAA